MNAIDVQSIAIDGFTTVPTLFWHRVQTKAGKVAMREKDRGIWKAYTWDEYGARARAIGMGLVALGLEPGDRAAILSDNNKEWLFCDLGVLCAAGVSTGIYPTDSPAQVEYLVNDSGTKFLFVENEEQLDKILAVRERTPGLKKIVVFDMEGLRDLKDPQVMPLEELYDLGETYARENAGVWEQRIALPKPGDVAIIVYTSGTTGPSKGALLEMLFTPGVRREELRHREAVEEVIDFLDLANYRDQRISGLPYGVRKVVELARALCAKPRLLLLDEPASGLNTEETEEVAFWIDDIKNDLGITVIMIEHDMSLVSAVSDRVLALNNGRTLALGTPAAVQSNPAVIEAYLGGEAP